jgi:hypothetical protein
MADHGVLLSAYGGPLGPAESRILKAVACKKPSVIL